MVVTSLVKHTLSLPHSNTSRIYLNPLPSQLGMSFIGGPPASESFLINLQAWSPGTLSKRFQQKCFHFPVKFAKFLITPFLRNTSGGCFRKFDCAGTSLEIIVKGFINFSYGRVVPKIFPWIWQFPLKSSESHGLSEIFWWFLE